MSNASVYAKTFADIIDQMKQGNAPWVRPWVAGDGGDLPYNAATKRPYSGGNVLALWARAMTAKWSSFGFVTFKQALNAKCVVRKGEKGSHIYWMSTVTNHKATEEEDGPATFFLARGFVVFNVDQLDELEPGALEALRGSGRSPSSEFERLEACDATVTRTGADVRQRARPYYSPKDDYIGMPNPSAFIGRDAYYGTLFHELGHWTGHASRLNRTLDGRFGDSRYAFEELVAELTASFLAAQHGILCVSQAASYMSSWVKACEEQPDTLARAAALASRAVTYITGQTEAAVEEPA